MEDKDILQMFSLPEVEALLIDKLGLKSDERMIINVSLSGLSKFPKELYEDMVLQLIDRNIAEGSRVLYNVIAIANAHYFSLSAFKKDRPTVQHLRVIPTYADEELAALQERVKRAFIQQQQYYGAGTWQRGGYSPGTWNEDPEVQHRTTRRSHQLVVHPAGSENKRRTAFDDNFHDDEHRRRRQAIGAYPQSRHNAMGHESDDEYGSWHPNTDFDGSRFSSDDR